MEQLKLIWRNLSDQLKILNEGGSLLQKIFSNSNQREISVEELAMLPEYMDGVADLLIKYGVLVEDNGFVCIDNPHLDYFLECQAANRRISVGIIKDLVDQLDLAIRNYQTEKNERKKTGYLRTVQKILRQVPLQAINQAKILKYEISEVYKQEASLEKKVNLLEKYDKQGEDIYSLIEEGLHMMETEAIFFDINCDDYTRQLKSEVYTRLISCHQWLSDIKKDALENIRRFRHKILRNKKIRLLKKLVDEQILEGETNIVDLIKVKPPIWLDKPSFPKYRVAVQDTVKIPSEKISEMLKNRGIKAKRRAESQPFRKDELVQETKVFCFVDEDAVWNKFRNSSADLLSFILSRQITQNNTWKEKIELFCKLIDMHGSECKFGSYMRINGVNVPIVRPTK